MTRQHGVTERKIGISSFVLETTQKVTEDMERERYRKKKHSEKHRIKFEDELDI